MLPPADDDPRPSSWTHLDTPDLLLAGLIAMIMVLVGVCVASGLVLVFRGAHQQDVATGYILCTVPAGTLLALALCHRFWPRTPSPTRPPAAPRIAATVAQALDATLVFARPAW